MKSPLGNAFYEFSRILSDQIHTFKREYFGLHYQWDFSLDKSLRPNLTFPYIYFSSVALSRCEFANLVIHDCREDIVTDNWITGKQDVSIASKHRFLFCGRHSITTVYPRCSNVAIKIKRQQYVVMDIHIFFSVFDGYTIGNIPPTSPSPKNIFCTVNFFADTISLQIFRVVVPRFLVIAIHFAIFPKLHLDLFDGPGPLSKPLTFCTNFSQMGNKQHVITSSFQCVIYCYNCRELSYIPLKQKIQGQIKKFVVSPGFLQNIIYPYHCQSKPTCFLNIETSSALHLNLSVGDMLYFGQNNTQACPYAGVAVYENEIKISTICVKTNNRFEIANYQHSKYVFQNIYSSNASLLLVIYSYKEYGDIQFTLRISTTRCQLKLLVFCISQEFSQVGLKSRYKHSSRDKVVLPTKADKCTILQFSLSRVKNPYFQNGKPKEKCLVTVHTENVLEFGQDIQIYVTGFFRGMFLVVYSQPPTFG